MKGFPIIFLLLILPAIQCTTGNPPSTPVSGSVDPSALLQELSGDLTGPNGTLKGLGLDNTVNNLLTGLLGPQGTVTSLLGGNIGALTADVFRFFLAPNGILSVLVGKDGILAGQSQIVENILNWILGPGGVLATLFGPNSRMIGERLEERLGGGIVGFVQGIIRNIIGPNGVLTNIFNGIFGRVGIIRRIVNGIFGSQGFLARIFGGLYGGGNNSGGNGGTTATPATTTEMTNTAMTEREQLQKALCQLQNVPTGNAKEQTCLGGTSTALMNQLQTTITRLSCTDTSPTAGSASATWIMALSPTDQTALTTFITCLGNPGR